MPLRGGQRERNPLSALSRWKLFDNLRRSLVAPVLTLSLLLCLGFSALSVLPVSRRGSLFPSAVTSLYVMYLAYSALTSEPRDYACNGLAHRLNAASGGTLAVGMVLTLASVVYSALRAGGLLGD